MSVSPSGLRSAMQKAATVFFLQWCSFEVLCSLSWKQQGLLPPCLADVPSGNDDFGKEFFFF